MAKKIAYDLVDIFWKKNVSRGSIVNCSESSQVLCELSSFDDVESNEKISYSTARCILLPRTQEDSPEDDQAAPRDPLLSRRDEAFLSQPRGEAQRARGVLQQARV